MRGGLWKSSPQRRVPLLQSKTTGRDASLLPGPSSTRRMDTSLALSLCPTFPEGSQFPLLLTRSKRTRFQKRFVFLPTQRKAQKSRGCEGPEGELKLPESSCCPGCLTELSPSGLSCSLPPIICPPSHLLHQQEEGQLVSQQPATEVTNKPLALLVFSMKRGWYRILESTNSDILIYMY